MSIPVKTPVAIVGYGLSGKAAEQLLLLSGIPAQEIHVFDDASAKTVGPKTFSEFVEKYSCRTYVVSPGFPLSNPEFKKILAAGNVITSELSLACAHLKTEKIIGITGSYGKSTTTALIQFAIQKAKIPSLAVGNIGRPLADYVVSVKKGLEPMAEWLVLELSSYQLENCEGLRLSVGAITSLDPNHLDRYSSLQHYYDTKYKILEITETAVVFNKDSKELFQQKENLKKYSTKAALIWSSPDLKNFANEHLEENLLLGQHQNQNITLSAEILKACGLPKAIPFLKEFPGLPHRLELVYLRNQILLINDSKATSLQSVLAAVHSVVEKFGKSRPLYLFLGGKDKNLPWENLAVLSEFPQLLPIFFGACGKIVQARSGLSGLCFPTLSDAITAVKTKIRPQDILLLSPGGSSLDEFKNFEERGRFFTESFN